MHAPMKYVEKGLSHRRQRRLAGVLRRQQDQAEPFVHAALVRQAAAEVLREDQAAAGLAARDRLALPDLHPRGAPGHSRRQEGRQRPPQREGRRDQGDDHRARRQDPDGEGLPDPRPLRRRDGHRHRVLQAPRAGVPRPRHPRPQRREAAQPRLVHGAARPRLGAHGRPDQPLQHDVRPLLHGREPGRASSTSWAGKTSSRCSTTPSPSSRAGRCRCSSPAASRRCRRTSSTRSATRARSATTACRRRPTASSSPRAPSSPRPRPRPVCATPTCSSTASATPPTRTAASATCST